MGNAIQQIADKMLYQWGDVVRKPAKLIRIVINPGDESMLDAFHDYTLTFDSEGEDTVFLIELPFSSRTEFSKGVVGYIAQQVEYWNNPKKPEDIVFERADWIVDYKSEEVENDASVVVANFNKLIESPVKGIDMRCSFVFNLKNTHDYDGYREQLEKAPALSLHR